MGIDMPYSGELSNDRVPCSRETKEQLRQCKRGGEPFDALFRKMMEQYDPDAAALADGSGATD